jgi:excisionase family DNA binding protein
MPEPPAPRYLKVSEIARELSVSAQSVREWIDKGLLPAVRLERDYRVERSELEAWLNRDRVGDARGQGIWEDATSTQVDGEGTPDGEDARRRKQQAVAELDEAQRAWADAIVAHQMAPPDPGFADRLRRLGDAARLEEAACRELASAGLSWAPIPDAERSQIPYELRPGTGRRGPQELWVRFDGCVYQLNHAITGNDPGDVAAAFGGLAEAAERLAEAVEVEDQGVSGSPRRRRAG